MNKNPRIIAAIITLALLIAVLIWLRLDSLSTSPKSQRWPPNSAADITMEEFVDVVQLPNIPLASAGDPSAADNTIEEVNSSTPAPVDGTDPTDAGTKGEAPSVVTTKQPSPVQTIEQPPQPDKGTRAQESEQEKAQRKVDNTVRNAFSNAQGQNNTASSGHKQDNSGRPGATGAAAIGKGDGVTGGWIMPKYANVQSTVVGSVRIQADVDSQGNPLNVHQIGGEAPAATTPKVVAACIAEVKRHRFTRTDSNAPATARATITFVFR